MFKPRGEAEWFKRAPRAYNSIKHDKAILYIVSGLYYDVKQLVSMDTTVPVVYGSAIYHGHSVHSGQTVVFLVYTTRGVDLRASHSTSLN